MTMSNKKDVSTEEIERLRIEMGAPEDQLKRLESSYRSPSKDLLYLGIIILLIIPLLIILLKMVLGQPRKTYIIKAGEYFTAIRRLEEFLQSEVEGEELLLCDPYISSSTLFPLRALQGKIKKVKILTYNIEDSEKLRDYIKRLKKETGIDVEVRTNQKIHDRYTIAKNKCWSTGTSIKDLGNKDTTIQEINDVCQSLKELFEKRWNEASPF